LQLKNIQQMKKIILLMSFFIGILYLNAQNATPCDAAWLSQTGVISGKTPTAVSNFTGIYKYDCNGTEDNPLWYKFFATGSNVNFTVNTSNCTGGNKGLTYALFTPRTPNCLDLQVANNCKKQQEGAGNEAFSTSLQANKLYYLQIDGLSGSQCDFNVTYLKSQVAATFATLKGNVIWDKNANCKSDAGDEKLRDALVTIKEASGKITYASVSDNATYEVVLPLGTYEILTTIGGEMRLWNSICTPSKTVNLSTANEVLQSDFLVQKTKDCAVAEISMSTQGFSADEKSILNVKYKNIGTEKLSAAVAKVTLMPSLSMIGVTKPFTKNNNIVMVNLGDLEPQQEGSFDVSVKSPSNFVQNQAVTNTIEISPNAICFNNTNWNGSEIRLSATCQKDSIFFTAKNIGTASTPINGFIIEDDIMLFTKKNITTLNPNDSSMIKTLAATGKTYRFEIDQVANFPGRSMPNITVEGCRKNASGSFSVGYVNQYAQDDADFSSDIDVKEVENGASYKKLSSYPKGYASQNYIPQNQDIEYMIRYRNTGLQTDSSVFIIDTLSTYLDLSTLRMGASNQPFTYEISDKNLLQIKFSKIKLLGNQVNADSSELFVQFRISQKKDVAIGTVINNRTAIFTSLAVPPYVSENVKHTVGKDYLKLKVASQELFQANVSVTVFPNPFMEEAEINIKGLENTANLRLKIIDMQGRVVEDMKSNTPSFSLRKNKMTNGVYFYVIENANGKIATGKIVVGN
jgi:Secretion system C-terminal sorting domain